MFVVLLNWFTGTCLFVLWLVVFWWILRLLVCLGFSCLFESVDVIILVTVGGVFDSLFMFEFAYCLDLCGLWLCLLAWVLWWFSWFVCSMLWLVFWMGMLLLVFWVFFCFAVDVYWYYVCIGCLDYFSWWLLFVDCFVGTWYGLGWLSLFYLVRFWLVFWWCGLVIRYLFGALIVCCNSVVWLLIPVIVVCV